MDEALPPPQQPSVRIPRTCPATVTPANAGVQGGRGPSRRRRGGHFRNCGGPRWGRRVDEALPPPQQLSIRNSRACPATVTPANAGSRVGVGLVGGDGAVTLAIAGAQGGAGGWMKHSRHPNNLACTILAPVQPPSPPRTRGSRVGPVGGGFPLLFLCPKMRRHCLASLPPRHLQAPPPPADRFPNAKYRKLPVFTGISAFSPRFEPAQPPPADRFPDANYRKLPVFTGISGFSPHFEPAQPPAADPFPNAKYRKLPVFTGISAFSPRFEPAPPPSADRFPDNEYRKLPVFTGISVFSPRFEPVPVPAQYMGNSPSVPRPSPSNSGTLRAPFFASQPPGFCGIARCSPRTACAKIDTSGCSAVASALRSGRRGRWFESTHPDHPECIRLETGAHERAPRRRLQGQGLPCAIICPNLNL